ncbi:MAG: flagellar biosynthesis protein FlhA [Candidatus Neomarinimicrobiota bacterium]|nr:flagellar biosynthesis protein FlhA [Candidatus Neomarinimicrobiota bacterium]
MADNQKSKFASILGSNSSTMLAVAVMMILGVMLLPMPTFIIDMFLVMNITGALVIIFVAMFVLRPLEFSVFPGLLLIVTLFRLSLNVATTRLILSEAYGGEIIDAFGNFVVGGNYIVGGVIFLILVIINFVVITKGATRIAEVSARFTLDAMPGKQMAIDADLNAGLIDDDQARKRRELIGKEADFYGAMDGASKFVRGDAVAGILMTVINIIGGLAIGTLQLGMMLGEAASTYTLLTIGDGLVAQIPALIISTAAGIIVTRATSEADFAADIQSQVTKQPKAVMVSAGVLAVLGLMPGMPFTPFGIMAGILAAIAYMASKVQSEELPTEEPSDEIVIEDEKIESFLHPDPFEIEIGYGLIPLVDVNQGGNLLNRISTIRKSLAIELGIIVPPIRIRDNIQLGSSEYTFIIHDVEVVKGEVMLDYYLVLNPDDSIDLVGVDTTEPTFGLPARWISSDQKERAEAAGLTVVEPPAVIATHLMEVLKANAWKLFDRQETQRMLDHLKETHSAVVEGLVPDLLPLGIVTQVLKNLLKEKIPVRNLVIILETLADYAAITKDADTLTEYVRISMADTITNVFKNGKSDIAVTTFDSRLEDQIMDVIKEGKGNSRNLGLTPTQVNTLFKSIGKNIEKMVLDNRRPAILVSPQIRRYVRSFIEPVLPDVSVLSFSELTSDTNLNTVGSINYPNES